MRLVGHVERIAYRAETGSAILERAADMTFKLHPKDDTLIEGVRAAAGSRKGKNYD